MLRLPLLLLALVLVWHAASTPVTRAVSSTIVIGEFRVRGPNGGSDEFVELYNLSSSPVNIGGWKLRGSNASGTVSTRVTITAGTLLGPGCHYLLTNSSSSGGPYSGSVPGNQTYATGITDDGGLAITLPDDTVVDQVGLSSGSAFKEGTPLASLGSSNQNRSYERRPGGGGGNGTDTDNNAADFVLITPSQPQNSSSACGTELSAVGAANPAGLFAGDQTLLTVTVTPGQNPPSTGISVNVNLTAIGGVASQAFLDTGDNVFSHQAIVSGTTSSGAKSLPVSVADGQARTASATISLTVLAPPIAIHEIQGSGAASAYAGQVVTTRGVVTGRRFNNGFFIQTPDLDADSDPGTSEGIFVFTSSAPPAAAAVGNEVRVTGTVQEFVPSSDPFSPPLTELAGSPAVTLLSSGNPLPAPITLASTDTDPAGGLEQLERFEGMRVRVDSLTVVAPTDGTTFESQALSNSNGVFYGVITGLSRPFREPGVQVPDALPAGAPPDVPRFDANPERLRVDSDGLIGALRLEVTAGATVTGLVGPLDYGFRTYTILPEPATPPTVSGNVSAVAVPPACEDELSVASFNVERFFDTVNDPGISDVALTPTAFANRLNKASLVIRTILKTPDIIGLSEVENLTTLQALANKVNADAVAAGQPNPEYVARLEEGNDIGGIDVGFLVKSAKVTVVGVTQEGKTTTWVDPSDGSTQLLNDRPSLVLEATVATPAGTQYPVTVIVNHLRSLIGVDDATVDGATTVGDRVRQKRRLQAEFLADLVQARQFANPDERIVLVGDFNAFQFNDGYVDSMGTIKGAPTPPNEVVLASSDLVNPDLVELVDLAAAPERYSFVFDGNAQELDHILASQNLLSSFTGLHYGRVNADFPESLRGDATRPERLSDHDPLVAYFDVTPPGIQSVGASTNVLWPPNHKMVDVTIGYELTDCGSASCTLSVTSNEPVNGSGDGNTTSDWEVVDAHHVRLRAERAGGGNGRVYTITIRCSDAAGNVSTRTVTVTVPKSQGKDK